MKKLSLVIIIVFNLGQSMIEYKPDYPIVNNLSGYSLNLAGWNWYPNNKEWREMDVSEIWLYLSYYSKNKYTCHTGLNPGFFCNHQVPHNMVKRVLFVPKSTTKYHIIW